MATKKYVSLEKLGLYDEKIKGVISAGDEAALDAAKAYADGLAGNYEAAGTIATAKSELEGKIATAQGAADGAAEAAAKAQGEVDALETLVGTLPEGSTVTNVVAYIDKKTEGIASEGAMTELSGRVSTVEGKVTTIEGDYLTSADKTELSDAIGAEKTRAEGIEAGLRTDVDAIKADYLKEEDKTALQNSIDGVAEDVADIVKDYLTSADKTELQGKIDAKAAQTALDAEVTRATGVEEGLQTQINTIMNNPDAEGAINSINEFTTWVSEHGTIADGMRTDINKNKDDIAAMDTAYKAADTALSGRLDTLEAIDHEAYVAADTALKTELEGKINAKADASVVSSQGEAIAALQGADTTLSGRIDALEGAVGESGSVAEDIAAAKQEAIDAAATDATSKANAAESAAKGHADSLNTAMNTRVEALEAIDHDHANKAELDLIATGDKAKWDAAAGKAHEHSNLSVLEGITSAKVTAWDAAEGNAKSYADTEIAKDRTRLDAVEAGLASFVEVSEQEILDLFA